MTDFLIRRFIKGNYNNELKRREKYSALSGIVGIICNVFLCLFKFAAGAVTNSVSITGDAVNNLSDASSGVVTIIGAKLANKPVDKDHPFGHGRMEYISALIVSFFIFIMGFELGKSSIIKIIHPEKVKFSVVSIIVLTASILIKLWMAIFNNKLYKETDNINLRAVRQDSLNDCLSTAATIAALLISSLTSFRYADGIMGVAVAVIVILAGVNIVKDIISNLLGKAPPRDVVCEIENIMLEEDHIVGVHDLIIHNYGPGRTIASAHAEVPCNMEVVELHEAIDRAEKKISSKLNIMMCIHMDPVVVDDGKINEYKKIATQIIRDCDESFSLHDFRVVDSSRKTNLIFDLVIPYGYRKENSEILNELQENAKKKYPRLNLVITIEHSFV